MWDMMQYYMVGPAIPPLHKYSIDSRKETELAGGKAIKYEAQLTFAPDQKAPITFTYYLLKDKKPQSVLLTARLRENLLDEGKIIEIAERGYGYSDMIIGGFKGVVETVYPDSKHTRSMSWAWGMNELIHYVVTEHDIDKVILAGVSRIGRAVLCASSVNERIDLTAPVVTQAHAVQRYDKMFNRLGNQKWVSPVYNTFAEDITRLPVDRHFYGALIAPRAYMAIMGADGEAMNRGHVEGYDSLIPVYEWLDVRENLGLADHAPRGHEDINYEDMVLILGFADIIFFNKGLENADLYYRDNSGPVRYGDYDINSTEGWHVPPPLKHQQ